MGAKPIWQGVVSRQILLESVSSIMKFKPENSEEFLKKLFYNAYLASRVAGMGWLQAKDAVSIDAVWDVIVNKGGHDCGGFKRHTGHFSADYVFGRMMKLYIRQTNEGVFEINDSVRFDYQSWCGKYRTVKELLDSVELPYNVL